MFLSFFTTLNKTLFYINTSVMLATNKYSQLTITNTNFLLICKSSKFETKATN